MQYHDDPPCNDVPSFNDSPTNKEVWNRQLIPICTITMNVLVSIVCKFVKQAIQSSVEH